MLQTLAGPGHRRRGRISVALVSLRRGLEADEVCLLTADRGGPRWRAYAGPAGTDPRDDVRALARGSRRGLDAAAATGPRARPGVARVLAVPFDAPGGPTVLAAAWGRAGRRRGGQGADRGCGALAQPRARARGGGARPSEGSGAAALAGAPARLPLPPEPRAAHAADGDPRLRVEPDGARRDLGRATPAALPADDRGRVGAPRAARRRPARLLGDRVRA